MEYRVPDGYDTRKVPAIVKVRDLTREEALALSGHAEFIANDGKLRRIKINGAVRTWKRDPSRIEVPCKYGLYEYATFYWNGAALTAGTYARMVRRVEGGEG
jgi:hypothetical protein